MASSPLTTEDLPVDILDPIFGYLSHRDRLRCAGVCQRWRELMSKESRWRSLQLDRFCCPPGADKSTDGCVFAPGIEEVKVAVNTPFLSIGLVRPEEKYQYILDQKRSVSTRFLRDAFNHLPNLRVLDLSAAVISPIKIQAFDECLTALLQTGQAGQLTTLLLPKSYSPTAACLVEIFRANPLMEKLTLTLNDMGSTSERSWLSYVCQMANRKSLKQLTVNLVWNHDEPRPPLLPHETGQLGLGLEALVINAVASTIYTIDKLLQSVDTPNLLHLELTGAINQSPGDLEKILYKYRRLSTLKIVIVDDEDDEEDAYVPMAEQFWSPLKSFSLSVPPENAVSYLTIASEVLSSRAKPDSLAFMSLGGSNEVNGLMGPAPSFLSNMLKLKPEMSPKISAIFFTLTSVQEWIVFKSVLASLSSLKCLKLLLDLRPMDDGEQDLADGGPPEHSIESIQVRFGNRRSYSQLPIILRLWRHVENFDLLHCVTDDFEAEAVPMHIDEIFTSIPDVWKLKRATIGGCLDFSAQPSPSAFHSAQNLVQLTFSHSTIDFGNITLDVLVKEMPLIEVFEMDEMRCGVDADGAFLLFKGLKVKDLFALSGWPFLKECALIVEAGDDVKSFPSSQGLPLYEDFRDVFASLTNRDLYGELMAGWKRDLTRLARLEVIAFDGYNYFPLIFGQRCAWGNVHFDFR